MTIKGKNTILLSKFLSEATIGEDNISWKLSQAETLALGVGTRTMMFNWLTADGTRGVNWNGTEFICQTSYGAAVSGYWFGNPVIAGGQDDGSGATFLAYKPNANSLAIGTTDGAGNISLKIEKRVS